MVVFLVVNNFLYYCFLLSSVVYIVRYIIFQMVCYLSLLVESLIFFGFFPERLACDFG